MAVMQANLQIEPPPSTESVSLAVSNAFQVLRRAHVDVVEQFQDLAAGRQRLEEDLHRITADQAELSALRIDVEAKLSDLAASTHKVQEDAQAVETQRKDAVRDAERLARLVDELDSREQVLAERQRKTDESAKSLAEKEESVAKAGEQYEEALRQLVPQREEIERQSQALKERHGRLAERSDELDLHAKELDGSRDALVAMRDQLLRDQSEIASHREALLTQIGRQVDCGDGANQASDASAKRAGKNGASSGAVSIPKAPKPKPKAGGGSSTDQFRKLRRDAKRKSIGL